MALSIFSISAGNLFGASIHASKAARKSASFLCALLPALASNSASFNLAVYTLMSMYVNFHVLDRAAQLLNVGRGGNRQLLYEVFRNFFVIPLWMVFLGVLESFSNYRANYLVVTDRFLAGKVFTRHLVRELRSEEHTSELQSHSFIS